MPWTHSPSFSGLLPMTLAGILKSLQRFLVKCLQPLSDSFFHVHVNNKALFFPPYSLQILITKEVNGSIWIGLTEYLFNILILKFKRPVTMSLRLLQNI